ncbi:MAG: hypothetical protein ACLRFQ_03235, partial [Alphaproteobacteria bacterium]
MADFQDFCRIFRRTLFVSVLCFAFGFMSARAEEYTIAYLNQYGDEISDLTPDRYTEKELPLARENLPNGEAVSIATGCELVDELWYWDDKMSEPVESIEPEPLEDKVLYGNLSCDENRIVTLNPAGKEEIGSKGTEQLYYYRNLGDYGEFFYNEYNGSKSAAGLASTIILPTYDTEKYTFLGYYADPDDMGTQCVDERGYITEYGFQQMAEGGEGETSWDAVYEERSVADVPQYTLTYDCGVNGTAPAGVTQNDGSNVQLANGCNGSLSSDYDFQGWYCVPQTYSNGNVYNGGDSYPLYDNTICTAIWTESNPCDPGTVVDQVILGMYDSDFDQWHESLVDNDNTTWSFPYGDVYLEGMCSNTPGVFGVSGNPEQSATSADNTYCWCRASSFTPTGGENPISLDNNSWVYSGIHLASGCTDSQCQNLCAGEVETINGWQDFFLPGLYTANICEYTLTYDCANGNNAQSALFGGNYQGGQSMGLWANGGNCAAPTNQTFDYWTCDNGIVNNNMVNPTPYDNMTCTAQWTQPSYTVTYNCNNSQVQQTYVDNNNGNGYFYGDTASLWQQSGNTVGSCQVPEHKSFAGWDCYDVNGYLPSGDGLGSNLLYTYVTFETIDDVLPDNVNCEAVWACDTANGYTLYNGVCINEYSIRYRPGSHGVFDSGYGPYVISFGPGANLGGGTWGQPWSTQTQGNTHIVANDNCYEFCGWSESQGDVCGSGSILSAGTQQGNYNHANPLGDPDHLDLYAIWGCASSCVASGNQCIPAPTTYTVTYHGGSCNASASTFNETVNAGASYTVENPECASSNSNDWLPTDGCRMFIGWSDSPYDSTQTASSQVVYGTCDACATQTGSCGTISNISSNIDLYAICDVMAHNVIYHNCDGDEVYTHSNAISLSDGAQSVDYTPLSPSDSQLSSLITPLSSFQGWATSETAGDDESWCGLESGDLYQELYGGNSDNDYYTYTKTGEICTDVDLYA